MSLLPRPRLSHLYLWGHFAWSFQASGDSPSQFLPLLYSWDTSVPSLQRPAPPGQEGSLCIPRTCLRTSKMFLSQQLRGAWPPPHPANGHHELAASDHFRARVTRPDHEPATPTAQRQSLTNHRLNHLSRSAQREASAEGLEPGSPESAASPPLQSAALGAAGFSIFTLDISRQAPSNHLSQ